MSFNNYQFLYLEKDIKDKKKKSARVLQLVHVINKETKTQRYKSLSSTHATK